MLLESGGNKDFWEFLRTTSLDRLFIATGLAMILLGVVGRFRTWIKLDGQSRVVAGALGGLFLGSGLLALDLSRFRIERVTVSTTHSIYEGNCPITIPLEVWVRTNREGRVHYQISLGGQDTRLTGSLDIDEKAAGGKTVEWPVAKSVQGVLPRLTVEASNLIEKDAPQQITVECAAADRSQVSTSPTVPTHAEERSERALQSNAGRVVLFRDFDRLSLKPEGYRDNRPSNPNHGDEAVQALTKIGETKITNGSTESSGVAYMAPTGFPYVQFDHNAGRILLHPGTFGTSQTGASLGFTVTEKGQIGRAHV